VLLVIAAVTAGAAWWILKTRTEAAIRDDLVNRYQTEAAAQRSRYADLIRSRHEVRVNPKDGLLYVMIPPGEFEMGCVPGDEACDGSEKPRHHVVISKPFWLSQTEVTVEAYKRFAKETGREMPPPPRFNPNWDHPDDPVVNVSWNDAEAYCRWTGGRLPTEAEWEYAARGGKDGLIYPWGNDITPEHANYWSSKWNGTSPAGSYPPNGFGLYDMSGNVWEWVSDWYQEDYYRGLASPVSDPKGPAKDTIRVLRGGSWNNNPRNARASNRNRNEPENRNNNIGFRCAWDVERQARYASEARVPAIKVAGRVPISTSGP
jgi:sulfatase modifying factor 1